MIFGRKKRAESVDSEELDQDVQDVEETADEADLEDAEDAPERDEWDDIDAQDWREEGPFDISEVDLSADEVDRVDLGQVVITPFEGAQLQLQVDEQTKRVRAVLATKAESGLEVTLFAAPRKSLMLREVRDKMIAEAERSGGQATLAEGPFGVELRRMVPVTGKDGKQLFHLSRTWLVQGPGWLLRGVVMGKAAQHAGTTGPALELFEFFANLVVRRGTDPYAAGELISFDMPKGVGE